MATAALVIAGCSSSTKSSTNTPSAGAASGSTSSSATGSPIILGLIGSFTGTFASNNGGVPKVVQAWVDNVNATGGLQGHPVKLFIKDLGDNTGGSLAAVKELVQQDHVVALIDHDNGDSTWASYIQGAGVPVTGGQNLNTTFSVNPDFFASGTTFVADNYASMSIARQYGPKTGLVVCAETPLCGEVKDLIGGLGGPLGISVGAFTKVSAGAPSYVPACTVIKDSGVQSFSVEDSLAVSTAVVKDCLANGVTAKYLVIDTNYRVLYGLPNPSQLNGTIAVMAVAPWFATGTPGMDKFTATMKRYAPSVLNDGFDSFNMQGYAGAELFAAAVNMIPKGDPITSAAIKTALYSMKDETLGGITPPLSYKQGQSNPISCYFKMVVAGGKWTLPQGLTPICPDATGQATINAVVKAMSK